MEHIIKLDKNKQILGIIVALFFIGIGVALLINPKIFGDAPFSLPKLYALSSSLTIIFLGLLIFLVIKVITKQVGVVINNEGITDNTSALKLGLVKWEEISGFGIKKQLGMPFITVYLKDPDAFIARYGKLSKKLVKKNAEEFNTPFAIGTTMLAIKADELTRIIEAEGAKHGLKLEE